MRVHLVRHTSVAVAPGVCYGQSEVALADTFGIEAECVVRELSSRLIAPACEVRTSPLGRCRRLAHYCGYTDALLDVRLLELHFGAWELMPYDEITDPRLALWYSDYVHTAPTEGESYAQQCQRVASLLDELRQRYATEPDAEVILFAHAGVLRATQVYLGRYTMLDSFDYRPAYGEVLTIAL